ncbi:MAG: manganese efflux pump MntP family protein [Candidatus Gracilibacteria bacterium]
MDLFTNFIIALALSIDAVSVATVIGSTCKKLSLKKVLVPSLLFGAFQGIMPVIGWFLGNFLNKFIQQIDHWIAFGLLFIIGTKMIIEDFKKKCDTAPKEFSNLTLFILAIATSIDALAIGLTFAFLKDGITIPAIIIALTTFITSLLAIIFGHKIKSLCKTKISTIGGLVLIIIGTKILIEHLSA